MAKQTECYKDGSDRWEVNYVEYASTTGDPGDRDEVIQIKKNGHQVGSVTWHLDKDGNKKTSTHEKGIQRVPGSATKVSC